MRLKKYISEYGLALTIVNSFSRILRRLHIPFEWIEWYYANIKEKICIKYHRKKYGEVISKANIQSELPREIFVFWYQGIQEAPDIVTACIRSIQRNSNGHKINLLDKSNYLSYVHIPQHIIDKFQKGLIGPAHFSDVIRFNLLNQRGGLWIDATCYVSLPLPDEIFTSDFYSLKDAYPRQRWTSFFIGGAAHNIIFENMCEFYNKFWAEHDVAFTYLFLDYQLMAFYFISKDIRKLIESTPDGAKPFILMPNLGNPYSEEDFANFCNSFYVQKLTYRNLPPCITSDGQPTILSYILENK